MFHPLGMSLEFKSRNGDAAANPHDDKYKKNNHQTSELTVLRYLFGQQYLATIVQKTKDLHIVSNGDTTITKPHPEFCGLRCFNGATHHNACVRINSSFEN